MTLLNATKATHPSAQPSNNKTTQVLVRVTPNVRAELESIAELEQRSLSAATRIMIERGLSQYQQETLIAD
ncbi:hypothetical protein LG301_02010 [Vreelandella venusta]|uniref:hypothetical protein n=1 Tax=Vreelandella venusta TaxID=44935 RepID=UPI00384D7499